MEDITTQAHANFPPSSAYAWSECIAWWFHRVNSPPGEAAIRGTLQHDAAEALILHGKTDGVFTQLTTDEQYLVRQYVDMIKLTHQRMEKRGFDHLSNPTIEERLILPPIYLEIYGVDPNDLFGTVDTKIHALPYELRIIDLKTGRVPVSPYENPQLKIYAGLALLNQQPQYTFEELKNTAVQLSIFDREGQINHWVTTGAHVIDYVMTMINRIQTIKSLSLARLTPEHYNPGEKQCKYCSHLGKCAAAMAANQTAVGNRDTPPTEISPEKLYDIYNQIAQVKTFCAAVEEEVLRLSLAGTKVGDLKLVTKRTHRAYKDPVTAAEKYEKIFGEAAFTKKLKTPAQIDKLIKLAGAEGSVECLKNLHDETWHKPLVPTIGTVDDKRPDFVREDNAIEYFGKDD
ncbi:MAG: hypothetical protein DRJ03_07420 [Chloroflexi bacterium]|nr:MAG: hypothetical protein DRJ03_07420 [Chloroflexota bacterium]